MRAGSPQTGAESAPGPHVLLRLQPGASFDSLKLMGRCPSNAGMNYIAAPKEGSENRMIAKVGIATACLLSLAVAPAFAADAELKDDKEKTLYALGHTLSNNLTAFELTEEEVIIVQRGFTDGATGKDPVVDPAEYRNQFRQLAQERSQARAQKEKQAGEAFLAKAATADGAEKTDSGLVYRSVEAGTGDNPKATDRVKVHYTGRLLNGKVFDSSVERGTPATFPLNGVIPCWTEGVQKMKVGGKAELICPSEIAYKDRGAPPNIQPGATLIFDVELLEIVTPAAKPKVEPAASAK